ncbi:MAG TPA: glycosyltransferase family 4 protein [Actinomycetota bacterium]|nr:glycosyltransferase family 4 protein [Actinomycetota bacterium]
MRILLWHGYLLRDSGSNIYTANLARQFRELGHDVLLLCQERNTTGLDFVDEVADLRPDRYPFADRSWDAGRCRVARPWIDDLLPVYVYDDYPGFRVKTFLDLEDAELERYTRLNVEALVVALKAHRPDVFIVGHEVMGPFIARAACAEAGGRYVTKLHGSALEYAVKRQPRYVKYAELGLRGAHRVVGGSEYMISEALRVVPGWSDQAVVVNPGCDTDIFQPRPELKAERTVGFVGKLIEAKGVGNLLRALPEVKHRPLRAVIVGDGPDAGSFHSLWGELSSRDPLVTVEFTGALDHHSLAALLPTFELLVAPSVVPEAFGMVVAEAAACGVLPIVPNHSGIAEAGAQIEIAIDRSGWLTFDSKNPVSGIAAAIDRVLAEPTEALRELEKRAASFAHEQWSWQAVARKLLEVSAGGNE